MCLLCVADEVPQPLQHCGVCGCPIVIYDGAFFCTPDECWCEKQPNMGEWHALSEEYDPPQT
jgi:uncharacterized Zn finger protein (UPF0148 family)